MTDQPLYKVRFELRDGGTWHWYLHSLHALQELHREARAGELGLLMYEVSTQEGDREVYISEPPVESEIGTVITHDASDDKSPGSSDRQSVSKSRKRCATLSVQ